MRAALRSLRVLLAVPALLIAAAAALALAPAAEQTVGVKTRVLTNGRQLFGEAAEIGRASCRERVLPTV